MADYRFSAQIIARSHGRSSTAAAAYRSGGVIADARTGEVHDYTRKGGIEWTGVMAPEGAPTWAHDREKLWNIVEQKEIRKDAQLAREVQLSLPHELNFEQRRALVLDFVQREFIGRGMVADIAMHKPDRGGDQRNFHVHIMLTTREIGPDGFGRKNRDWNGRSELTAMRAAWAEVQNEHLRKHLGPTAPQVTHLSYAERGEDKFATVHLGPTATGMERRGIETLLGNQNRDAARRNQTIRSSRKRITELELATSPRASRSLGYVANEARLQAKMAIDAKRNAEGALRNVVTKKATLTQGTSRKALEAQVIDEAKEEVRRLKRRLSRAEAQAGNLKRQARSLSRWVTNPTRMIWLKIAELHQRDRLEAALRLAEARLFVRREWLDSADGKSWVNQGRRSTDWRQIRTEERRLRRQVRRSERLAADALAVARKADSLQEVVYGRTGIADSVELPVGTDGRRYVSEMTRKIEEAVRSLPPDLGARLGQVLSKGRGRAD